MLRFVHRLRRSRAARIIGNIVAGLLLLTGLIGLPTVPDDLAKWGPIVRAIGDALDRVREVAAPLATDVGRWLAVATAVGLLFLLNYRAGRAQPSAYPVSMAEESRRREARDRVGAAVEERWEEPGPNQRMDAEAPASNADSPNVTAPDAAIEANTVEWCERHRSPAMNGLRAASKSDYVEVCATVSPAIEATQQRQLLDAVRENNIDTFGWPIGVVIESRADSRPRPTADGVVVDFSWHERGTYDYWAMSLRGDFFTLTNLSEDVLDRPDALLFNTRIVRVAETVMFLAATYRALGAADNARVSLAIHHVGLSHRVLSAAGGRRHTLAHERTTTEPDVRTTATFTLREADESLVDIVKSLLSPVFHLYEFCEFADEVYKDIVTSFAAGRVT